MPPASIPRPSVLFPLQLPPLPQDRKTKCRGKQSSASIILSLNNKQRWSQILFCQAASAVLICKDWHPDDDFSGVIYRWQVPILSCVGEQLDSTYAAQLTTLIAHQPLWHGLYGGLGSKCHIWPDAVHVNSLTELHCLVKEYWTIPWIHSS